MRQFLGKKDGKRFFSAKGKKFASTLLKLIYLEFIVLPKNWFLGQSSIFLGNYRPAAAGIAIERSEMALKRRPILLADAKVFFMEESAFLEKISELGRAEKQKQKMLADANEKAVEIVKEAQIKAQKIGEKAREEAVRVLDGLLAQAAKEAVEEEKRILNRAKAQSAKFSEKTVSGAVAKKIAQKIIGG